MNGVPSMQRLAIVLAAGVLAAGCAGREPQRDSSGLVRVPSLKPGNLFAHPTRSIDDYDDVWVAEVGIAYGPKQEPMIHEEVKAVGKLVRDVTLEQFPIAEQLPASEAGPCTLKLGVHLAQLEFPRAGAHNNGGATVILEFQDSETGEPLVRFGQRRELSSPTESKVGSNLGRIQRTMESVLEDVGHRLRDIPVKQTGALADRGCQGKVGEVRKDTHLGKE